MIFAAGMGTRLKPLTDIIPKALIPVAGKPLLQRVLERVDGKGNRIVVNIHHHADQIRNFLDITRHHWMSDISVSDESEKLLETGGGIRKASPLFTNGEPVLIHNCDIISNADLDAFYQQSHGNDATLLVSSRKTQRYLLFDDTMRLVGWTNITTGEVKSPYPEIVALSGYNDTETLLSHSLHMYAFSGIHTISPSMFTVMNQWPERFPIMDFYLQSCKDHVIRGIVSDDLRLLDVGKLDTLESARGFLNDL